MRASIPGLLIPWIFNKVGIVGNAIYAQRQVIMPFLECSLPAFPVHKMKIVHILIVVIGVA